MAVVRSRKLHSFVSRLVLAGALAGSIVASPGAALADGMWRGSIKDAPAPAPWTWTGLYVGASVGYGWGDVQWTNNSCSGSGCANVAFPDLVSGNQVSHTLDGVVGGGQVGYNFQSGRWVYGLEAAVLGGKNRDSSVSAFTHALSARDDVYVTKLGTMFLGTARLGYTWDRLMIYAKGGFASADVETRISDSAGTPANIGSGGERTRHNGFTLGTGLEYLLTRELIFGVQYDFVSLQDEGHALPVVAGNGSPGVILNNVNIGDIHLLTARLSLKF